MSIAPVIIIGCGGSGGKVVLNLKRRIGDELLRRGWTGGIPSAWQFRWIDVPTVQERYPEFGPPLAATIPTSMNSCVNQLVRTWDDWLGGGPRQA
jgi:hypothetical protein